VPAAVRALATGISPDAPARTLLDQAGVREAFRARLSAFAESSTGSSTFVRRIVLLDAPLSIDRGELTDKGSVNQRAVLRTHAALVDEIYAGSPRVIEIAAR
jgi:feruloyl-CoA synthase